MTDYQGKTLTLDLTNRLLDEVVAEFGEDHVYVKPVDPEQVSPDCLYVHEVDGKQEPGCIVAQVLHKFGVPLDKLVFFEGVASFAAVHKIVSIEKKADILLDRVQSRQDLGEPWGEAVRGAREELAEWERIWGEASH